MIRTILAVLVLLFGTGGYLEGQAGQGGQRRADPGPVEFLLTLRAELGLTSEQVARLEEIDSRMDRQNQPYVARMSELRRQIRGLGPRDRMTVEQRELHDSYVAEARPLMRQIHTNNRAAMRQVGDILSPPQKERVGQLLRERLERQRSSGNPRLLDRGD
jgi:hypothetical protein